MPANLARIYSLLGQQEKAIDELAIVFSRPGPALTGVAESGSILGSSARSSPLPANGGRQELGCPGRELDHRCPPNPGKP